MAQDPQGPPESITLGQFKGIKNVVAPERLAVEELEKAINVDLDDVGQLRRRRGYTQVVSSDCHSLITINGTTYVVSNGTLSIVQPDYSLVSLYSVGAAPVAYTSVDDKVYFCNASTSGIISGESVSPWGSIVGTEWVSPVIQPTETLGAISGKLIANPPTATVIEYYRSRIYLAVDKYLWATEPFLYDRIDKTRNFMGFEHEITLVMAVDDGLYVGTTGGLYFIKGVLGSFRLTQIGSDPVLPGSGQRVPADLVHPQARNGPVPTGEVVMFMTTAGIVVGLDGGTCYNLTQDTVLFPEGVSAASLFRQDQGANSYVAAVDSAGGPAGNMRIGDYVDAEIRRFGG